MSSKSVIVHVGGTRGGIKITPSGAIITGTPDEKDFEDCLIDIVRAERACKFALGDLMNAGEKMYGEKYGRWSEITGYAVDSLYNIASTCNRVPINARREALSFTHHREVAGLPEAEQGVWLETAEKKNIGSDRLAKSIKLGRVATKKDMQPPPPPPSDDQGHDNVHPYVNQLVAHLSKLERDGDHDDATGEDLVEFAHDIMPVIRRFSRLLALVWDRGSEEEIHEMRRELLDAGLVFYGDDVVIECVTE